MNIVLNLCVVAVILVGGFTAKTGGTITPGNTMAAITYLAQILHGITFMANIFQTFSRARASADRINVALQNPDLITDGCSRQKPKERGTVEFLHVSFAYPESDGQYVLEDISFQVKQGETLAIIGATGNGKSSLVHLIPRFYDATKDEVLVDGINVKDYTLTGLRDKISIVLQKAELYSHSISENIRWSRKDAAPAEIKAAAAFL